jgi:hypothetical protein
MTKFRTRLLAAFGVTAGLLAVGMLAAMQSADSQPAGARGAETAANGPPVACAHLVERDSVMWTDTGYYQSEYAARLRCDPAASVVR